MTKRTRTLATSIALSSIVVLSNACSGSSGSSEIPAAEPPPSSGAGTPPPSSPDAPAPSPSGTGPAPAPSPAPAAVRAPTADGPFAIDEKDATATIASTGDSVAIHAAFPKDAGSFPVVVLGHGFQLAASQYYGYLRRLASFGYVALTVDFPTSFLGNDNPREAKDLVGGIDWAAADATLGPKTDATKAAMTGHSLGGKLAVLAATLDPRIKAVFTLDPVDAGGPTGCSAPKCVVVKERVGALSIPTGFLGETTDATGNGQACAPAADNFATFYANAKSPSLQVTINGANHMSFLDDPSTCGVACGFCKTATASNARVVDIARAMMTAFFERHVRGNAGYDAWLTGAQAQAAWVTSSEADIVSK